MLHYFNFEMASNASGSSQPKLTKTLLVENTTIILILRILLLLQFLIIITTIEGKYKILSAEDPAIAEIMKMEHSTPTPMPPPHLLIPTITNIGLLAPDGPPTRIRCGCKGLGGGPRVCANNGIQYKNMCVFECMQKQNPRLTVIKTGSCEGLTRDEYFIRSKLPEIP